MDYIKYRIDQILTNCSNMLSVASALNIITIVPYVNKILLWYACQCGVYIFCNNFAQKLKFLVVRKRSSVHLFNSIWDEQFDEFVENASFGLELSADRVNAVFGRSVDVFGHAVSPLLYRYFWPPFTPSDFWAIRLQFSIHETHALLWRW